MVGMGVAEETRKALKAAKDRTIKKAIVTADVLCLEFEDGSVLKIHDVGQTCCELRYMTCDDELSAFEGAEFWGAQVRAGPDGEGYDVHETQFLHVRTSQGTFTVCTHVEHNGYYGGFELVANLEES